MRSTIAVGLLAAFVVAGLGCAQPIRRPDVVVGTASPADVDYPLGGSICRLSNLEAPRHGLRCAEEPSADSVTNVESLLSGRIDVGIVPSDVLADAVAGEGQFASQAPATELRVLFAGHADVFTLVVQRDSGIRTLAQLRGRRIGIGNPGSRQRTQMERVMAALGLTRDTSSEALELAPSGQDRAFCEKRIDAIVYSVGHPNGAIRDVTRTCDGVLLEVAGPEVDRMLSRYDGYERAVILADTYSVNPADVASFGVRAVVVTTTRMSDTVAYEITRAVFDRIDVFRRLHPAFESLSVAEMVQRTGRAPVHPGAARYFRERGWPR